MVTIQQSTIPPPPLPSSSNSPATTAASTPQSRQAVRLDRLAALSRNGDLEQFKNLFAKIWSDKASRPAADAFQLCFLNAQARAHFDIIAFLLEQGIPLDPPVFGLAVRQKQYGLVVRLLGLGYDINRSMAAAQPSALTWAFEDIDATKWMLEQGADPNARCEYDITPVSVAVASSSVEVIKLLLTHGGSVYKGQVLHNAALRNRSDRTEVLQLVLDACAESPPVDQLMYQNDPKSYNWYLPFGIGTPLHFAAAGGDLDAVKLLIARGANPATQDPRGLTALDHAQQLGHDVVVHFLETCPSREPVNTFGKIHSLDRWNKGQLTWMNSTETKR